ncbi:acetolactate synthase large subunit, partial [Candidatus Sumerlaeota bacterium]|nr:acetolactate synthase large subunit [Candidatus Sumerlaeota bacterium]
RTFISSGGMGTMGFGFLAAIGAQMAHPDRLVIDIAGDGSIQMNIQELATAVIEKIPVKVVILNNLYLGMVRQWQELFYQHNYSAVWLAANPEPGKAVFYPPDFAKLCEAYGALGIKVTKREEVRPAIDRMLAHNGPVFVDFWVEEEENCWPMIPGGKSIKDMMGQPKE